MWFLGIELENLKKERESLDIFGQKPPTLCKSKPPTGKDKRAMLTGNWLSGYPQGLIEGNFFLFGSLVSGDFLDKIG